MPPDAEPLTVSQRAAAVARSHVSTRAEAGRQYLNAPSYSFDFAVAVEGTHDAKRVADLYCKRYRALPAKIELAGGQSIALGQLTRRSAFEFLDREQGRTERALVRLEPARDYETVQTGTAFVGEAVGRLGQAELVPAAPGASSISFRQAEPAAGAEAAAPRVLNVVLADREERVLAPSETLAPERDYLVRLDIGPTAAESIVAEPVAIRVDELAPSSPDGWWFDALVASSDVDVAQAAGRLFLPFTGPSWVCDCPGPEHVCSERERRPHLFVPFRTRVRTEEAILRCTIYDRNNAVQSVRVEFVVADGGVAGGTIRGVVDYSLADDVGKSELLAARELNVLSNETPGGTHTIVVKNGDRAITVYLSESEAAKVLKELRDKLTAITLGSDGTSSQYDDQNQKRPDAFIRDLKQLALLGSVLYAAVVPDRDDRAYLRERLRNRATIQISRVTKTVFPWALVYVIPRELNATWTLCPLLEQWDSHRTALAAYPDGCPFKDQHQKNVLCPYGFWGFSHLIEQPLSVRRGALRTTIRVTDPDRAVAARSLALDSALTTAHFSQLRAAIGSRLEFDDCDSLDLLRDALADPDLPLVYFYCHGKTAVVAGTQLAVRFLEIGTSDRIGPEDFSAWDEDANWGPRHWSVSAPLVFINGCETAMLSPDDVVSFVDALAGMHVAGVIGTEIAVTQRVAGEVALRFYTQWAGADNETVGMALYRTRIDLLRKGNVSGLVYTPFCSMDLALEQAG